MKKVEVESNEKLFIKKEKSGNDNVAIAVIITVIICAIVAIVLYKLFFKERIIETTKYEKSVTVTDVGIADAVEKVYDSVVVVETFVKGNPYASGTGFIFKKDDKYGYILTNNHVISNANSVTVTLVNDKTLEATVVGSDEYSDIAVLSIPVKEVTQVCETGSSENMRVGDTTFAVGAPLDASVYSWSVTRGILSGKNRLVEVSASNYSNQTFIMEVLQTDAAINSGNSGGPLCNSNGEVIGVTNMKLASSSIEGMGFAIPIEDALEYANIIIKGGVIQRPYLGVYLYDASNSYYAFFGGNAKTGLYVQSVEKGSPAEKGGMLSGDKVLKIGNKKIDDSSHFKYELFKYKIGDNVKIVVERDGKEKELTITLGSSGTKS